MDWFDLLSSDHFLVVLHSHKEKGLIFNRLDNTVATISPDDARELSNLKDIGQIFGIVGRFLKKYLVVIKERSLVGTLYEPSSDTKHRIYVINQVQALDISAHIPETDRSRSDVVHYDVASASTDTELGDPGLLRGSTNSSFLDEFSSLPTSIRTNSYNAAQARGQQWFRLASLKSKTPAQLIKSAGLEPFFGESSRTNSRDNEMSTDSDKKLVEEMVKLFNNTNSFYFSPTLDLTKRFSSTNLVKLNGSDAIWKTADERFFWNRYMLKDLLELSNKQDDVNLFICVILQGFIAIRNYESSINRVDSSGYEEVMLATNMNIVNEDMSVSQNDSPNHSCKLASNNQLALISRRSVFQAGTRYRRRGCDEDGNVANFVETEQIIVSGQHFNSYVILRGSIPLFWYQTGYNYRPPPVLVRGDEENHLAFTRHFSNLSKFYGTEMIINVDCTEDSGREKIIHDAYKKHINRLRLTNPNIKHIEFDFHKHRRGRQISDLLVERQLKICGLSEQLLKETKYYWNDGNPIWNQDGIFRVNCLDCTDRTNVVQRVIALQVLDLQLARLGIITPDTCPEDNNIRKLMQILWSTNGNVLSTQYCGTRALFTGDRKLAGYLKDTYSSASRYYISKFRDAYRQAAIDAMLGVEA